ncbi:MAG: RloB family protein [Methanomassiliicoccales archaeon]
MSGPYRSRRYGTRDTLKHLVIFCEGERTEVIYFNHYRKRGLGVKIEVRSDRKNDPVGLVGCALKRITDAKDPLDISDGDVVWCVFDADTHKQVKIEKAREMADGRVRIALSTPCFELWFLLHFIIPTVRMTSREAVEALNEIIPEYRKDLDVFDRLEPKRDEAIKNAARLAKGKDPSRPCVNDNPHTSVHILVMDILEVLRKNKRGL